MDKKFITRKDFAEIELSCMREPYFKIVKMQIQYYEYNDGTRYLSPVMNCHNEYGLDICNTCKDSVFNYIKSLQSGEVVKQPITLDLLNQ